LENNTFAIKILAASSFLGLILIFLGIIILLKNPKPEEKNHLGANEHIVIEIITPNK
jgi:uncharacterized membrane protein